MIESIDNNNTLKRSLQRKLASVYDCTSIANYIDNTANSANIEALNDALGIRAGQVPGLCQVRPYRRCDRL